MSEGSPKRVLSGVQPTGELHLGNYFGAIVQHIALQDEFPGEAFYFIADYHALTTVRDAQTLRQSVFEVAVAYLALGLDPEKALLFRQSDVPEVTELMWMLSCGTGMGLLERATSYKDKLNRGIKPNVGLFTYPILMAADILLYRSSLVPVGKDQVQHVEMAQDMATHFTECFPSAEPVLLRPEYRLSSTPKVPGLDGEKMSKSYNNTIPIFATGKKLKKLVARIVTSAAELGDPLPIEGDNVLALLALFCDAEELQTIEGYYRTGQRDGQPFGYGHAKQLLTAKIESKFADARGRREALLADPQRVEDALKRSAARARVEAQRTLALCRHATGLR
ncbi:MAG: tryptophan--tRNA ligase [Nannocystaceae bacterium]|nr:tryptophan--tRNA ligase [Nannocystaceae bacterium]